MIKRITIFSGISLVAITAGFFIPVSLLKPAFHYTGYYFMLAGFTVWGALLLYAFKNQFLHRFKTHFPAFLLAIALMALIFHMSPPKIKILADEINLVSVSMAMHQNKTASMPLQGLAVGYYPFDYDQSIDQRPLFYPFALSIIHAIFGYSAFNGFIVNFLSGAGTLFVLYLLFFNMFSRFYGIIAIIVTASFPIFGFWSTSSGFETINLFFIVFVLFSLFLFLKHRDTKYAELVLFSLILLANCRYESILFFFCLIFLAPCFLNKGIIQKYRWPAFLIPLFFLPLAWQRQLIFFNPSIWQAGGVKTPENPFGLENFFNNFSQNLFSLTGFDADFGFVFFIFALAVAGTYLAVKKWFLDSNSIGATNKAFGVYLFLSGTLLFILYNSFYWGQFTTDIDNRLALSFLPFVVIPAVYSMYQIPYFKSQPAKNITIFLLLAQLLYYWPIAARHFLLEQNNFTYINDRITRYLYANHDLKNQKLLLISDRANFYVIHGIGSINFKKAIQDQQKICYLADVYYDQILVIQKCNPATGKVFPADQLEKTGFTIKPLARINISPKYYFRISEAACCTDN